MRESDEENTDNRTERYREEKSLTWTTKGGEDISALRGVQERICPQTPPPPSMYRNEQVIEKGQVRTTVEITVRVEEGGKSARLHPDLVGHPTQGGLLVMDARQHRQSLPLGHCG